MNVDRFEKDYSFLSNFYISNILTTDGKIWSTAEHLFQACKTNKLNEKELIFNPNTPGEAKKLGRKVTLLPNWELIKYDVMRACVFLKFNQNFIIQKKLIDTHNSYLIEGNLWHDNCWGDCFCDRCKNKKGKNYLGIILMGTRDFFIKHPSKKINGL